MEKFVCLEKVCAFMFSHQIHMKLYHFQTDFYGAHKASDEYLEKFNDLFDKFMEVFQGGKKKLKMDLFDMRIQVVNDETIIPIVKDFIELMSDITNDKSEINNIRDEIVANARQFLYLMTFK